MLEFRGYREKNAERKNNFIKHIYKKKFLCYNKPIAEVHASSVHDDFAGPLQFQ